MYNICPQKGRGGGVSDPPTPLFPTPLMYVMIIFMRVYTYAGVYTQPRLNEKPPTPTNGLWGVVWFLYHLKRSAHRVRNRHGGNLVNRSSRTINDGIDDAHYHDYMTH